MLIVAQQLVAAVLALMPASVLAHYTFIPACQRAKPTACRK
jgi:hypothetical protein